MSEFCHGSLFFNLFPMLDRFKTSLARVGLVTFLTVLVAFPVGAQSSGPFPDVGSDDPNVTAITFMKDNGVFEGYPDGTYQPDRVLNRAEQLKVYMLLHGLDPSASEYNNCFPDVKDEWFARFVCFAKEQGWVEGYPDGTFKPAQEVNKVEALKMLGEIQGWNMTNPSEPPFDDTPASEWYAKYVAFAKSANLLEIKSGNFSPSEGLTRGSTAEVLFRSLAVYALDEPAYSSDLNDEILAINVADLPEPDSMTPPPSGDAPEADYGDAPESGPAGYAGSYSSVQAAFPTLYDTANSSHPGAHALDSSMEWLGDDVSMEMDANDPNDPDGMENLDNNDAHDEGVTGLNIVLISIPPPATLTLNVTTTDDAPSTKRYINAIADLNMDGEWGGFAAGGEPEWIVKNQEVDVTAGETKAWTSDPFAYSNGWILTPTSWVRVVLSREPINASDWDGSGEFKYGEVEDYYVQLPDWDDGSGGSGGGPGGPGAGGRGLVWGKPAPTMTCPSKVTFPTDVDTVWFACQISNWGGNGDVKYDLWEIVAGVLVTPTTGTFNMPTAPPGFPPFGVVGNPTFKWFKATRGTTPSTWGYKVVGIDPESTVEDSIIDLGLMPGDLDEGYEAGNMSDIVSWAATLDDYYLFGDGYEGPLLVGATFLETDDANYDYHIQGIPHVRFPDGQSETLTYSWGSPSSCGFIDWDDETGLLDWTFDAADAAECMEDGLELTVNGESDSSSMDFFDVFADTESEPQNAPPVFEAIEPQWLNDMADDPHMYNLTVYATDPEDDPLTYTWMSVTCGVLDGGVDQQTAQWSYPKDDMAACSDAEVTVQVTDGENVVEDTLPIFSS